MTASTVRQLYPPIEPYYTTALVVSERHTLYIEASGNPEGKPVIFLHGGPGGGTQPTDRQFFDPSRWHIILFDQRGCGRSHPHADLTDNTTWHLVADIEKIRAHFGIDTWVVFGGSWGSTLALIYAQTYPERCSGLILRGIFTLRPEEIRWLYQAGANYLFPDAWETYLAPIPPEERNDLLSAYHRRLNDADPAIQLEAARTWSVWEASTSKLTPSDALMEKFGESSFAIAFARIECHYFMHGGFLESPCQIINQAAKLWSIPGIIVQGRYDVICPMKTAWELHRAWPESKLVIVPAAGHSSSEPGIISALVDATDCFASR
ncbi:MAG: prolyl aminopeptidase [Leptolyngbyaceae cyanobacterium]